MQPARARDGDDEGLSDAAYTNNTLIITLIITLVTSYELIHYTCQAAADVAYACAAPSMQLPVSVCCSCRYLSAAAADIYLSDI